MSALLFPSARLSQPPTYEPTYTRMWEEPFSPTLSFFVLCVPLTYPHTNLHMPIRGRSFFHPRSLFCHTKDMRAQFSAYPLVPILLLIVMFYVPPVFLAICFFLYLFLHVIRMNYTQPRFIVVFSLSFGSQFLV